MNKKKLRTKTTYSKEEKLRIGSTYGKEEKINHPKHYNFGKIEVIDVIEDWKLNFHTGNAIKYIGRSKHKGTEKEDLLKAIWYLQRYAEGL